VTEIHLEVTKLLKTVKHDHSSQTYKMSSRAKIFTLGVGRGFNELGGGIWGHHDCLKVHSA